MKKEEILKIFKETGVMLEGHFLLTSGRHSDKYIQCAKLFTNASIAEKFSKALSEKFQNIDIVIGPAVGGIILAYEVSRQLGVPNIFAERENGKMILRRGFSVDKGAKVLIVEDVITTGGSVRDVMMLIQKTGAQVAGVGCIVDRSDGKVDFGVPFSTVLSMEVASYDPKECPLCKTGIPAIKPGSRQF
ncbi:MAG: orotate phosphoribosyltransferase [Christensenellales bacterium]|jgi:orotate phosphoribosyltransferase